MRRNLTLLPLLAVCLMLLPMVVFGAGGDGLVGSPHDFVRADHAGEFGVPTGFLHPSKSTETRTYDLTEGTPGAVGLCAFCHTPHRAIMTSLLWNHTLSTATFTWADADRTVGGTMLPTNIATWKGSSKLCLSCHDGSVAIGDLAWYQGAVKTGGDGSGFPTQKVSGGPTGAEVGDTHEWPDKYNVGARDGTAGAMKGNHPVGIPYPFGQVANVYNGITTGDGVLKGEFDADPTTKGIRLYKESGLQVVTAIPSGYGGTNVGIECGSCHDPHNGPTVEPDTVTNRTRLVRGTVYGDGETFGLEYLCTKCHTGKN